jgi:archaellum component FlaF (FlaF/FlaG flagellin family)
MTTTSASTTSSTTTTTATTYNPGVCSNSSQVTLTNGTCVSNNVGQV